MSYKIKKNGATILQALSGLLQHALIFKAALHNNEIMFLFYFIAAFILFYLIAHKTTPFYCRDPM